MTMSSLPRPDYQDGDTKSWTLSPTLDLWWSPMTSVGWYLYLGAITIDITEEKAHALLRDMVAKAHKQLTDMHVTPTF